MKSILVVGLGRFGRHTAMQLNEMGHEVMAVDLNETRVNEALPYLTGARIGDSTSEDFIDELGVDGYDLCIVTIAGDFQSSLETTLLLKEMGARYVVARAERDVHAKFLLRNGADEVVYPERQMARWTAVRYGSNHILDYIELDDDHAIFEVTIPKHWLGKTVGQLEVRKKYHVNIMALKQNGRMELTVTPDTVLTQDKTLLVLGEYKALQKCFDL